MGAPALSGVARRLRDRADQLADTIVDEIRAGVPTYGPVDRESLRRSLLQHVDTAAGALERGLVPAHVSDTSVAAQRARSGIPIEDVLLAIRLAFQSLREFVIGTAQESSVELVSQLEAVRLLWEVNDLVSREYAVAHRDEEIEMARAAETHRAEFVRRLMREGVHTPEMSLLAASFGLVATSRYRAFRARPDAGEPLGALLNDILVWGRRHRAAPFGAVVDGEAVGVLVATEDAVLPPAGPTLGLGPAVDLPRIPESARVAGQMMEVGHEFGRTGPQTMENLSLHVAVAAEHDVGDNLVERIVAPLLAQGDFGRDLVASLDAFLAADLNTAEAAAALVVHPNTLRYRLQHVKRLTDMELRSPVEIAEAWWALRRYAWTQRRPAPDQQLTEPVTPSTGAPEIKRGRAAR